MRYALSFVALLLVSTNSNAACEIDVEVGDSLVFSTAEIVVPSTCESVTINLSHTGQLPVAAMGHNWVLTTEADFQGVANDGVAAGVAGNYLPADDERVIAATSLIGGGESASVSFSIADLNADESYTFFCSFPGHWAVMKGTFQIH